MIDFLHADDIVFFDDCLFSQYNFLRENHDFFEEMAIDCMLGFSSGLYASENAKQVHEVESYILHDACNSKISTLVDADCLRDELPEMAGFMKISQLKELLQLPFCHLALHGCCHLNLQNEKNLLKKIQMFKHDLDSGCERLNELGLVTNTYVYPYVYSFATSDVALKRAGFKQVIGGLDKIFRITIEDLASSKNCQECGS